MTSLFGSKRKALSDQEASNIFSLSSLQPNKYIKTDSVADLIGVDDPTTQYVIDHIDDPTIHFVEGSIDHKNIMNVGNNTHTQIDTFITNNAINDSISGNNSTWSSAKTSAYVATQIDPLVTSNIDSKAGQSLTIASTNATVTSLGRLSTYTDIKGNCAVYGPSFNLIGRADGVLHTSNNVGDGLVTTSLIVDADVDASAAI